MRSPSAVDPLNFNAPGPSAAVMSRRGRSGRSATSSGACPDRWTATASGRSAPLTTSRLAPRYSTVHAVTLPSPAKLAAYSGVLTSATAGSRPAGDCGRGVGCGTRAPLPGVPDGAPGPVLGAGGRARSGDSTGAPTHICQARRTAIDRAIAISARFSMLSRILSLPLFDLTQGAGHRGHQLSEGGCQRA